MRQLELSEILKIVMYAIDQADDSLSNQALHFIKRLYTVERHIKQNDWNTEQIQTYRQTHSEPILQEFHIWLLTYQEQVLPKSITAKAINYLLNHWQALNKLKSEEAPKLLILSR